MFAQLFGLFAAGRRRRLPSGAPLFRQNDSVVSLSLVEDGEIELVRHGRDGSRIRLHRCGPGQIVAEASAHSEAYHCDGLATGPTVVWTLDRASFLNALTQEPGLALTWADLLARGLQNARALAEIRSLHRLPDRLDAWLAWRAELPPRGAWRGLAEELGVSPEALYRELARRRP